MRDVTVVAFALFVLLTIGSSLNLLANKATKFLSVRSSQKAAIARLDSLSDIEHQILSYLIQAGQQSFDYRNDDGDVQQLVGKGLLYTPPGMYGFYMVPFIVPDFVWKELKRRKSEFHSAAPPCDQPWVKNWMAY